MIIYKSFGEIIRNLREEKCLTLKELSDKLEIDTSMLGKIEKNNRKPTKQLINKLARIFKVSTKDLKIAFISDKVVNHVMDGEDIANEVLKVAEKKVMYLISRKDHGI